METGGPRQPTVIRLQERGSVELSEIDWRSLAAVPTLWRLVEQGILSVSYSSPSRVQLNAGAFVGRALVGDKLVEVTEKIPGSLIALIGFASSHAFRLEKEPAPASEMGELTGLLIHQFLDGVSVYVSKGREFVYRAKPEFSSLAGGRLLVGPTAMLWARGLNHLLASERSLPTHATPKNRVLLAAVREIEEIGQAVPLDSSDVMAARGFADLFSDCLDTEVAYAPADRFAEYADDLVDRLDDDDERDLLTLAAVILSHEGFEWTSYNESTVPRSWFLNLEKLFERAVRQVLDRGGRPWLRVSRAAQWLPSIFSEVPGEFRADPDLVVHSGPEFFAIGDVKYKDLDRRPAASDLYQLLVHAAAFRTDSAFLIYPAPKYTAVELGDSATGSKTWVFGVDVKGLEADLELVRLALKLI